MTIEQVKGKTSKSGELLFAARELAEHAARLPEDSEERRKLEERITKLVEEAEKLTDSAKQEIGKYK